MWDLPTFDLSQLLIEDMIKISGFYLPFEYIDLMTMMKHSKNLAYREPYMIKDVKITLHESGHIIGGATVIVEHDGKRIILYWRHQYKRLKNAQTRRLDFGNIDLMIMESTYSQTEQVPESSLKENYLNIAYEVVERGGTLFIPAFSVERAQEIACVLKTYNFPHKIANGWNGS